MIGRDPRLGHHAIHFLRRRTEVKKGHFEAVILRMEGKKGHFEAVILRMEGKKGHFEAP